MHVYFLKFVVLYMYLLIYLHREDRHGGSAVIVQHLENSELCHKEKTWLLLQPENCLAVQWVGTLNIKSVVDVILGLYCYSLLAVTIQLQL